MKALVLALLLNAGDPLVIDTSDLAEDQRVTATHDGVNVTVVRRGDTRHVYIDRGGAKDEVSITRDGDRLRVGSIKRSEGFLVKPAQIIVDGVPVEPFLDDLFVRRGGFGPARYYVCPKDETMLCVPSPKGDAMFKCPVDGTVMEPGHGPSSMYFLLETD